MTTSTVAAVAALVLSSCGSTLNEGGTGATDADEDLTGTALSEVDRAPSNEPLTLGSDALDTLNDIADDDPRMEGNGPEPDLRHPDRQPTRSPSDGVPFEEQSSQSAGRGITADTIHIGFATIKDVDATAANLAIKTEGTGDQEAAFSAIIEAVNARGGIAGRTAVPVFYDVKSANLLNDPNREAEAACAFWTQDNEVFAVVNLIPFGDRTLASCLAKRDTPLIYSGNVKRPKGIYAEYDPYLYAPTQPSLESLVTASIRRAAANNYFEGWNTVTGEQGLAPTRVGIYTHCCNQTYSREFIEPARVELARHSQRIEATFEGSERLDAASAQANSAVLRFREAGVTHVLTNSSFAVFSFAIAAESQNYRPRYLISTLNSPRHIRDNTPAAQLRGALGIGHFPSADVDNARDPGDVSPAQARCREVVEGRGHDTSNRQAMYFAYMMCDGVDFLVATLEAGVPSASEIRRRASTLGSLASSTNFLLSFAGQPFYGTAAARDLAFDQGCSCFVYLDETNHAL